MQLAIFTDIDDTLMSTPRKLGDIDNLLPASVRPDGTATSYQTAEQAALWAVLARLEAPVIPVSARSPAAFQQLRLSFKAEAILDFGGSVYDAHGSLDSDWSQQLASLHEEHRTRQLLGEIKAAMAELLAAKTELRLTEEGLPCFLNFRFPASILQAVGREVLRTWLDNEGLADQFSYHETDRDITLLPWHVSKRAAVQHVIAKYGYSDTLRLGIGDSLSDAPFMQACHFQVLPSNSRAALALGAAASRESRGC